MMIRTTSAWLGAGLALVVLASCASLPDSGRDRTIPHAQQVELKGARGPVSAARSDAILQRLEGSHGPSDVLHKHLAYEQSVNTGSPLVLGNKLTLLQNGPDTYHAMFVAIEGARDHINLETFIFDDDEAGQAFSDLLLQRQAAGVQVNIVMDAMYAADRAQSGAVTRERWRKRGVLNRLKEWAARLGAYWL